MFPRLLVGERPLKVIYSPPKRIPDKPWVGKNFFCPCCQSIVRLDEDDDINPFTYRESPSRGIVVSVRCPVCKSDRTMDNVSAELKLLQLEHGINGE